MSCIIDLIRHGEPQGGVMYRGHRDDPLSDTGWQQMQAAIHPDERWDAVITSPLLRCRDFADALSAERQLPLTVVKDFQEISFGEWEGLTPEQVQARDGERLAAFWADAERHSPPGGEPVGDFHRRIGDAWQTHIAPQRDKRLLLVCHGGVIRMVLAHVLGLSPAKAMARIHVPYACRSQVRLDDTPHGLLACLISHGPVLQTNNAAGVAP